MKLLKSHRTMKEKAMLGARHLLAWHECSDTEWERMVHDAVDEYHGRLRAPRLHRRHIGLVFFNPSLRTLTSMEVAANRLGASSSTIIPGRGTWDFEWRQGVVMDGDRAEHIHEAIGVLSRYYDALGVRAFASGTDYASDRDETRFKAILAAATVPVINLESAFYHPCQALADAATLHEHFSGAQQGKRFVLAWAFHPKALPMAVPNSALLMAARMGMQVTIARPEGFELDAGVMARARQYAAARGQSVTETTDLSAAAADADVIYTKAWGSALAYESREQETMLRQRLRQWRVTAVLMARTNAAAFMHCLPVRRNVVVDDAVIDSPNAIHLLQAEFRLHAQVAILARILG